MLAITTSLKLNPNGNLSSDNTVLVTDEDPPVAPPVSLLFDSSQDLAVDIGGVMVNYTKLMNAARAAGCPEGEWVFVRCSMTPEGVFQDVEWQLTPFNDERAQETNKMVYDALVPKEVQDGVRTLRPFDETMSVNTEAGLYDRETWDAWDTSHKVDAAIWDRKPHLEADTLKLARFYNHPCGALVHVLDTDTLYISDVKPYKGGGILFMEGFEVGGDLDDSGWAPWDPKDET